MIDLSESFEDTASILKACHACITVDTSVAHLSGALGVKTWILLKHSPCWRWGTVNSQLQESCWYETAKIISQEVEGEWDYVIEQVYKDLSKYLDTCSDNIAND